MADEMEILVFEISGEANYSWTTPDPTTADGEPSASTKLKKVEPSGSTKQKKVEKDYINILNTKAEDIADDIQGELRKYLMHGFKIQAEIGFSGGSIILSGTIILIGWAGPVIADAARKELSEIVRVGVRRVIGRYFSENQLQCGPMEITVQERRAPQYVPPRREAETVQSPRWLPTTVAILAIAVALLIADRFFSFSLRPEVLSPIHSTGIHAGASSNPSGPASAPSVGK